MASEKVNDKQQNTASQQENSNSDEVSRDALVNLLIKEGVCTSDEIAKAEEKIRANDNLSSKEKFSPEDLSKLKREIRNNQSKEKNMTIVNINNPYDRGRFPSIKRAMSKHRWSRRLGTWLFGWKWRKVKKTPKFE